MHVLILGGYGTFGGNIARLLAGKEGLTLILAGRNLEKATAACRRLNIDKAQLIPAEIDRNIALTTQINLAPNVIIDATGPFQNFKGQARNHVIHYALQIGAHYLDLSDDTNFIRHIESFDAAAKTANITALSGLSTYPVLSVAIAQQLRLDCPNAHHMHCAIAPSPKARLGKNVLAAILNAAGRKAIYERQNGQTRRTYGLIKRRWAVIAPPLERPLKALLCLQVDSPEAVFFKDINSLKVIENYAAPQPIWMLQLLNILSHLARLKLFPPLRMFTRLCHGLHNIFARGEHRSGYYLHLENMSHMAAYHLTAEGDDGPLIPSLPAVIIIERLLNNRLPAFGARSAGGEISLAEYETIFDRLKIHYGRHISPKTHDFTQPVYRQALDAAYDKLPPNIQSLHDITEEKTYHGKANIIRGKNPLAHVLCVVFGFPKAGNDIDVSIRRKPLKGHKELWERRFNGKIMRSTQEAGTGREAHMIIERFGPLAINLAYYKDGDVYRIETRGWRAFGCPMPRFLCPYGDIYERAENGRFHFHVELCAPLIGRLVKYVGWFNPAPETSPHGGQTN